VKTQKWIGVNTRLPRKSGDVWVVYDDNSVGVCTFLNAFKSWESNLGVNIPVFAASITHWMPMIKPKPPKRNNK
jgi:Protein of unknown function (DUF551)